jgi:hypothetical protein
VPGAEDWWKKRRRQQRSVCGGRLLALDETWIATNLLAFHPPIIVRRNDHRRAEVQLAKRNIVAGLPAI